MLIWNVKRFFLNFTIKSGGFDYNLNILVVDEIEISYEENLHQIFMLRHSVSEDIAPDIRGLSPFTQGGSPYFIPFCHNLLLHWEPKLNSACLQWPHQPWGIGLSSFLTYPFLPSYAQLLRTWFLGKGELFCVWDFQTWGRLSIHTAVCFPPFSLSLTATS